MKERKRKDSRSVVLEPALFEGVAGFTLRRFQVLPGSEAANLQYNGHLCPSYWKTALFRSGGGSGKRGKHGKLPLGQHCGIVQAKAPQAAGCSRKANTLLCFSNFLLSAFLLSNPVPCSTFAVSTYYILRTAISHFLALHCPYSLLPFSQQ